MNLYYLNKVLASVLSTSSKYRWWLCMGFIGLLYAPLIQAQSSVLSKGNWYKIATTQTGVHRINAAFLRKAGIDISKINPQNIRLYGNGGSLLPQSNNQPRPNDLIENAIEVVGETDGKFDENDYVIFHAESPHTTFYDASAQRLRHQNNYYSDSTFYFLTISDTKGLRVKNGTTAQSSQTVTTFDDFKFHELDQKNLISSGAKELSGSGREWYGEAFGINTEQSFNQAIEGLVANSPIQIASSAVGTAYVSTQLNLKLNNATIGTQTFQPIIAGQYDAKGIYDLKGKENTSIFTTTAPTGNALKLTYTFNKGSQSSATAYLNYFEIQSKRTLQFYETQSLVRSLESLNNATTQFKVAQTNAQSKIWDISNAQLPDNIAYILNGSEASFGVNTQGILKTFILFSDKNLIEPHTILPIANQNLHEIEVPDLLIVTLPEWKVQAERLAEFRRTKDKLSAVVATVDEVYNEFASGKPDISAVRDFARFYC